jgi:hypothetical protein
VVTCPICGREFKYATVVFAHARASHRDFDCGCGPDRSSDEEQFRNHVLAVLRTRPDERHMMAALTLKLTTRRKVRRLLTAWLLRRNEA